ncbi:type II secretion system F family protein [Rossellomorea sp. NS-SX7]|uniref:type II secretion system F family protein n=1 Tax=Rossellomorea sp. NS-SX7 TaxID=3463856 RepID=UPI004057EDBD
MGPVTLIIGIFMLTTILCYFTISNVMKKKRHHQRVERFLSPSSRMEDELGERKKDPGKPFITTLASVLTGIQFSNKTKRLLVQAGSSMSPAEFLAVRLISAGAAGTLFLVLQFPWILAAMTMPLGYLIPKVYMIKKRRTRLQLLPSQLIDTLGMMANSMRAGFSFMQVMQLVGKEMPAPIGPEFEKAVRESGLGVPLETIFEGMVERLPSKELEVVLDAIIAQRKSGGNLTVLMETMEDTIRGRLSIMGELNTLTSQGKMSSLIITFLPIGLGIYLFVVDPDYFSPLVSEPLGIFMLVTAGICIIIGWFSIQKILRIEV